MEIRDIFELIADANKDACEITWNVAAKFQENAGEAMKTAFVQAPLPQTTKDVVLKNIDAYTIVFKQILDASRILHESVVKAATVYRKQAGKMTREDLDRALLQQYSGMILSL